MFDEGKAAYRRNPGTTPEQITEAQNWEKNWGQLYDQVKAELTPGEHVAASRSIRNAHYTSREVVNKVWDAVEKLGRDIGEGRRPSEYGRPWGGGTKAWSQNLGHEEVLTTFRSYGAVGTKRQGEIVRGLVKPKLGIAGRGSDCRGSSTQIILDQVNGSKQSSS